MEIDAQQQPENTRVATSAATDESAPMQVDASKTAPLLLMRIAEYLRKYGAGDVDVSTIMAACEGTAMLALPVGCFHQAVCVRGDILDGNNFHCLNRRCLLLVYDPADAQSVTALDDSERPVETRVVHATASEILTLGRLMQQLECVTANVWVRALGQCLAAMQRSLDDRVALCEAARTVLAVLDVHSTMQGIREKCKVSGAQPSILSRIDSAIEAGLCVLPCDDPYLLVCNSEEERCLAVVFDVGKLKAAALVTTVDEVHTLKEGLYAEGVSFVECIEETKLQAQVRVEPLCFAQAAEILLPAWRHHVPESFYESFREKARERARQELAPSEMVQYEQAERKAKYISQYKAMSRQPMLPMQYSYPPTFDERVAGATKAKVLKVASAFAALQTSAEPAQGDAIDALTEQMAQLGVRAAACGVCDALYGTNTMHAAASTTDSATASATTSASTAATDQPIVVDTPIDRLLTSIGSEWDRARLEQWAYTILSLLEEPRHSGLLAKTSRENGTMALDFGWHAETKTADRNAGVNGRAYSYGTVKASELIIDHFANGAQHAAQTLAEALYPSKDRKTHNVPRLFAAHNAEKHSRVSEMLGGNVVAAAARLISELLREYKPAKFAKMDTYARNYRLADTVWTSGRLAFMREGASVDRHPDHANMPGTDGADLILNFGGVTGATLTMHIDGKPLEIDGEKTVLADFLNQHEVSEMRGSGLRVAFVFWQQRATVVADHVLHVLGATRFDEHIPKGPICHYFWHTLDAGADGRKLQMRELNLCSMRSSAKYHPVWLWTYQQFDNLPEGVTVKDANKLLPFDDFQDARSKGVTLFVDKNADGKPREETGRHVAQLSDLFRALALQKYGGWWLDADTIVLRRLPSAELYYFPTVAQKRGNGGHMDYEAKAAKNKELWGERDATDASGGTFHWDGGDTFQSTPLFIREPDSELAAAWVEKLHSQVLSGKKLRWSDTIKTMQSCIEKLNLHGYICPPELFCPWPFWARDLPLKKALLTEPHTVHDIRIPTVAEVQKQSYAVQFFFMSSEKEDTAARDDVWLDKQLQTDSAAKSVLQPFLTSTTNASASASTSAASAVSPGAAQEKSATPQTKSEGKKKAPPRGKMSPEEQKALNRDLFGSSSDDDDDEERAGRTDAADASGSNYAAGSAHNAEATAGASAQDHPTSADAGAERTDGAAVAVTTAPLNNTSAKAVEPTDGADAAVTAAKKTAKDHAIAAGCKAENIDLILSALKPPSKCTKRWTDVKGLDRVQQVVQGKVIDYRSNPGLFNCAPPSGILLFGHPGTGKTSCAMAIATEMKCNFLEIKVDTHLKKGGKVDATLITTLFEVARGLPDQTLIFIDECRSLFSGRAVTSRIDTINDVWRAETLPNLLVVGATNYPAEIQSACDRRFEIKLLVPMPTPEARREIIESTLADKLGGGFDSWNEVLELTQGYSAARLKNFCSDAEDGPVNEKRGPDGRLPPGINKADLRPINLSDFQDARDTCPPDAKKDLIDSLEDFNTKYGTKPRVYRATKIEEDKQLSGAGTSSLLHAVAPNVPPSAPVPAPSVALLADALPAVAPAPPPAPPAPPANQPGPQANAIVAAPPAANAVAAPQGNVANVAVQPPFVAPEQFEPPPEYIPGRRGFTEYTDAAGQEWSQCRNCNGIIGAYVPLRQTRDSRQQTHRDKGGASGCQHPGSKNMTRPRSGRGFAAAHHPLGRGRGRGGN